MAPGRETRRTSRLRELASVAVVVAAVAAIVVALVAPAASRLRPILPPAESVAGTPATAGAVDVEVDAGRWRPKTPPSLTLSAAPASPVLRVASAPRRAPTTSVVPTAETAVVAADAVVDATTTATTSAEQVLAAAVTPATSGGSVTSLSSFTAASTSPAPASGRSHGKATAAKATAKSVDKRRSNPSTRDLTRGSSTVNGHDDGGERGSGGAPGMAQGHPSDGVGQGRRGR